MALIEKNLCIKRKKLSTYETLMPLNVFLIVLTHCRIKFFNIDSVLKMKQIGRKILARKCTYILVVS